MWKVEKYYLVNEEKNLQHSVERRKYNWIGNILHVLKERQEWQEHVN